MIDKAACNLVTPETCQMGRHVLVAVLAICLMQSHAEQLADNHLQRKSNASLKPLPPFGSSPLGRDVDQVPNEDANSTKNSVSSDADPILLLAVPQGPQIKHRENHDIIVGSVDPSQEREADLVNDDAIIDNNPASLNSSQATAYSNSYNNSAKSSIIFEENTVVNSSLESSLKSVLAQSETDAGDDISLASRNYSRDGEFERVMGDVGPEIPSKLYNSSHAKMKIKDDNDVNPEPNMHLRSSNSSSDVNSENMEDEVGSITHSVASNSSKVESKTDNGTRISGVSNQTHLQPTNSSQENTVEEMLDATSNQDMKVVNSSRTYVNAKDDADGNFVSGSNSSRLEEFHKPDEREDPQTEFPRHEGGNDIDKAFEERQNSGSSLKVTSHSEHPTVSNSSSIETPPLQKDDASFRVKEEANDSLGTDDGNQDFDKVQQNPSLGKKTRKEGFHFKSFRKDKPIVDECDSSTRCNDAKNNLIACLRVPGNESPNLSLLIQNKGTKALTVKISAPGFGILERTVIHLKEKEDRKLKVSWDTKTTISGEPLILLSAGDGQCVLNVQDMLVREVSSYGYAKQPTLGKLTSAGLFLYLSFASVLLIGGALIFVKLRGRAQHGDTAKYHRLDTDIQPPSKEKLETETIGGWDDKWGDNWDDEEAPITPSKPIQNLSSKGLASRKLNNKDGWQNTWKD